VAVERLGADQHRFVAARLRLNMVDEAAGIGDREPVAVLVGERMREVMVAVVNEEPDLVVGRVPESTRTELAAFRCGEALNRGRAGLVGANMEYNRHL
jgi:hypothetical protein